MKFTFELVVEVERVQGKFATRDEIAEALEEAVINADPGSIDGIGADGESEYEVTSWDINEVSKGKGK